MAAPRITFFSELESEQLSETLSDSVINDLVEMEASLSLGIIDLSSERAQVVQRLNRAGVPVIAWLLLPREQGYWFNLRNAPQAKARYRVFKRWTEENDLTWDGIGLDIEPDLRDLQAISEKRWRILPEALKRLFHFKVTRQGRRAYRELVAEIQADGYRVDSYQLPVIVDERRARATILQRVTGIINLTVDREVWMLYSSFVRPHGAALIASYASEAQAVGLGVTGVGMDEGLIDQPPLTWEELANDLRLAWYYCEDIHLYSLEGCLQQGFMPRLKEFLWDVPILTPDESLSRVEN